MTDIDPQDPGAEDGSPAGAPSEGPFASVTANGHTLGDPATGAEAPATDPVGAAADLGSLAGSEDPDADGPDEDEPQAEPDLVAVRAEVGGSPDPDPTEVGGNGHVAPTTEASAEEDDFSTTTRRTSPSSSRAPTTAPGAGSWSTPTPVTRTR